MHAPLLQLSAVVQALPSLHAAKLFVWMQPVAGLQESSVQGLASSHVDKPPLTQTPPAHTSSFVHASPSSQGALLFAWTHPVAGSQESSVQSLASLQSRAGPLTQAPPLHVSTEVQAFPSLHAAVLFV
jgi:hypothetical protein